MKKEIKKKEISEKLDEIWWKINSEMEILAEIYDEFETILEDIDSMIYEQRDMEIALRDALDELNQGGKINE